MSHPLHILIVAQHAELAHRLEAAIAAEGTRSLVSTLEVHACAATAEAAAALEGARPDVLVLTLTRCDVRLCAAIHAALVATHHEVPVIVLAPTMGAERMERLRAAGAAAVWPLPSNDVAYEDLARLLDWSSDQSPTTRLRSLQDHVTPRPRTPK